MKILFVCSGNLCRSPTAAYLFKHMLDRMGIPHVEVSSSGTVAIPENPVAPLAVKTALEHGVDMTGHRAIPLTEDLIRWADRIVIMQPNHRERVLWKDPAADPKIELLSDFLEGENLEEILDPYGKEEEDYRISYHQIRRGLERLAARWFGPGGDGGGK